MMENEKVLLATLSPVDHRVTLDFSKMLRDIQLPPRSDLVDIVGLPFGPARNQAAKMALDNGYILAFLDADIRCPPDSYMKLLETRLDIVSGLYYQKVYPFLPLVFNDDKDKSGNLIKVPIAWWKPGDIIAASLIPAGMLLVRRGALEAIFSKFPRPFEWGVDVVRDDILPPLSEDFTFSWRAKQIGYQPHCHTGIVGLHEVCAVVGPRWILGLPSRNPLHGVCDVR